MNVLIVFARAPVEGMVKTRLEKDTPLDISEVCVLYRSFLSDVLSVAADTKADKILVNYSPAEEEDLMREIAKEHIPTDRLILEPQTAETFHGRVGEAFYIASQLDVHDGAGATATVMIGSDSPTIRSRTIDEAFDVLGMHGGAVLGPSGEGGIYLIGLKGGYVPNFKKIFEGAGELSNFATETEKDGVSLYLLEEVLDVDVASDLVSLVALIDAMKRARRKDAGHFPENTRKTLENFKLHIVRKNGTRDKVLARGD